MTTFRLEKQSPGETLTRFHVLDNADAIVGIITVANEAVSDLQKHWKGARPSSPKNAANADKQDRQVSVMVVAVRKQGPRVNKAAILRGC